MALFNSNKAIELKAKEEQLEARRQELDHRDEANKKQLMDLLEREENVASQERTLHEEQITLQRQKIKAKNDFTTELVSSFDQHIQTRLNQMNETEARLNERHLELSAKHKELIKIESELLTQKSHLEEREAQAKAGYPELKKQAASEIERLSAELKKDQDKLHERQQELDAQKLELERTKNELRNREDLLRSAEALRDDGFRAQKEAFDLEFAEHRAQIVKDHGDLKIRLQSELNQQLENEARQRRVHLDQEFQEIRHAHEEEIKKQSVQIKMDRDQLTQDQTQLRLDQEANTRKASAHQLLVEDLEKRETALNELVAERVKSQQNELAYQRALLNQREEMLTNRQENLNEEVERRLEETRASLNEESQQLKQECDRLRVSLNASVTLNHNFEDLKAKLGGEDPASVFEKLRRQEEELVVLRDELSNRPGVELRETFKRIQAEKEQIDQELHKLNQENIELKKQMTDQRQIQLDKEMYQDQLAQLKSRYEALEANNLWMKGELERLTTSYQRTEERYERIKTIEMPYFEDKLPRDPNKSMDEIEWLNRIEERCAVDGFKFPRRILDAYHTSLKIAEHSPITVLAGVSGTGKSKLPELYAKFGGLNFLSLPVQPNWDSQESMLGFFNSIDNKFDAQPVLRLLAQSQMKKSVEYPLGLSDTMTIILLDEMNLAHVELYFAEFLSKLELRRGKSSKDIPSIDIKLGAGMESHKIKLGRNVLWTGTMNQDETTKSLSDKVLDRGIVINFPRPTTLNRRISLPSHDEIQPLLSKKVWQTWLNREISFSAEQVAPYKAFIEEMNQHLASAGRAMGHRVWQSIEAYMDAYPHVLLAQRQGDESALKQAMDIAFEDQLVQKVMPKLRGIETRGQSKTQCLDKIRNLIIDRDFNLTEDFDHACQVGYGQFMWSSAYYLASASIDSTVDSTVDSTIDENAEEQ